MAVWCIGFAVVNVVVFEGTDRFANGPYAEYASGFAVMNWLVVGLKVLGAAVALLSVGSQPRLLSPALTAMAIWAIFATLGVYVMGSVVQALGMLSGLAGNPDQLNVASVGYPSFFLLAAAGYGVLAISYSRRHRIPKRFAILGMFGAPAVLGLILLVIPTLMAGLGIMPALP